MKICIIGIGYVGLPSGACLAQKGHEIILVDVDQEKVDKANKREPILYEKGLEEILKSVPEDKFKAVLGLDNANKDTDLFFICVGTPSKTDGGVDLRYIWKVAEQIGKLTKDSDKYFVVCVRSTVPPETTEKVGNLIEKTSGKKAGVDFGLAMNPEFLQEGKAVENFLNPTRQIFGGLDEKSLSYLEEAYAGFDCPKIKTDLKTAEMTKYACNTFLAIKISFANEIGNICKEFGVDQHKLLEGMGFDNRINTKFLKGGKSFGGSCLPKDMRAIIEAAETVGYHPVLLEAAMDLNRRQAKRLMKIPKDRFGFLRGSKAAVLGLAFKEGTDDIRESPSIDVVKQLLDELVEVNVYDPLAIEHTKEIFNNSINYFDSPEKALEGVDFCFILNNLEEFRNPELYKNVFVIDAVRAVDLKEDYEGICW